MAGEDRDVAPPRALSMFDRGGEMGERMRAMDWSATPFGPADAWPQSLQTAISICLASRFPMCVRWGPELLMLYNDGYIPILGQKHPAALGKPGKEVWGEIWDVIGPMLVEGVLQRGEASWSEDQLLVMHRFGFAEETYFTWSYSPIRDESGGVGGVFTAVSETTSRMLGDRRLSTLQRLGAQTGEARTIEAACVAAVATLGGSPHDVPFALLYLLDPEEPRARLAATAGLDGAAPALAPAELALGDEDLWPFAEVARSGAPSVVRFGERSGERLGAPGGPWPEPANTAVVLPVARAGQSRPYGFLVAGASPRLILDDAYLRFFDLVARTVAGALDNANAYAEERRRAESLAELDHAKTTFFSNISHELRTPLTLMLGPTEDLLGGVHGPLPEAHRRELELLHRSELRLSRLVNTLLDFSRIGAGRIRPAFEPLDLAALTRELAGMFRPTIERAGLALHLDCPPLGEPVYVDRGMWEKIVLNLVSNAFKFTFEGRIEVSLHRTGPDGGGAAALRVADTGIGVPESEVPRLFERFHRVEGARSRTHEGSGIGLALVQELAKLHGGTVEAQSRVGAGTAFTVTIPLGSAHLPKDRIGAPRGGESTSLGAEAFVEEALRWLPAGAAPLAAPLDTSAAVPRTADAHGRTARILLAEDSADMRDYVQRILEAYWEVEAVADGAQALAAARARPPDLVLTDVMMPELDGFALLRELRDDAATRLIPVVMISARAGEEARLEGLGAGVDDYLVKPFSARELVARVRTHLELARLREELRAQNQALYALFQQAPVPIAVIGGAALVYEMANELYFQVCGRSDIVGKPLLEALPELAGQGIEELFRNVLETGESFVGREMLVKLDRRGEQRLEDTYWTFIYAPLRSTTGEIERVLVLCNDVTEQVFARRKIEQSEEKFRRIVDQVEAGIIQADLSGWITLVNERFCEIVGRSAEELRGHHIRELTHPDDVQETMEQFQRLVTDGTPVTLEKRYLRPDGTPVWVQNNAARIDDPDGRAQGAVAVGIDITERRRAERALREREEEIHRLLRSEQAARHEAETLYRVADDLAAAGMDTGALVQRITDRATELVGAAFGAFFYNFTNDAGESYLLYTLSGAPKEVFAGFGLPRNTPIFAKTFSGEGVVRLDDVTADPRYGQLPPHHGMPAGHLPVVSYLAVPVLARSGEVLGGLFFGHPEPARFTEQHERMGVAIAATAGVAMDNARLYQASRRSEAQARESEERYRRIFETAEVSMWDDDLSALQALVSGLRATHGAGLEAFLEANPAVVEEALAAIRVRDVNPATLRLFGAASQQELTAIGSIFLPETTPVLRDLMLAIAEGRRQFSAEAALRTVAGKRLDVVVTMSLPPEDAVLDRVLVTLIDISDRKIAEAEREARLKEAERALTFSETFVGILGHDLRNPLGAILAGSDLLLRRETNERVFLPVQRIRRSADRMTRMIEQILDLTRARLGGGIPIAPAPVDLEALTDQLVEELEGTAPQGIVVEEVGDMRGHWDRDRLAQAISNLIGNAIEHGAAGEAVRLSLDGTEAEHVRIRVWNAGAIPDHLQPTMFDPFRRAAPEDRARKSKGLGLGLYIVQQIVLAHGGTIEVRSSAGEGTAFTVTIPRAAAARRGA